MTTGKTIDLTRWTFVGKIMSLLFNMLSRLFIAYLSRSKCLLISWLQSPSAVIWEPPKIKSLTVSIVSPSVFHEMMGLEAMILVFSECWVLSQIFHSLLSLLSRGSLVFAFCLKGGVICISEVIGISPGSLDCGLCFIQPAFRMMYFAYTLNKQGDSIQPWGSPFPIWNQSVVPCPVLTVASWLAYRFLRF